MKNVLFVLVVAISFFANASFAGITLTIAGFNPASAATSSSKSSKGAQSKAARQESEKAKKLAANKASQLTKSKKGAPAGATNATLSVVSANYDAGSGAATGRRASGSDSSEAFVVTRNMDGRSGDIANAAQTSRVYSSAVIANSSGPNITLTNVYLSSYSTSMSGSSSVETFRVHFQTQNVN